MLAAHIDSPSFRFDATKWCNEDKALNVSVLSVTAGVTSSNWASEKSVVMYG